MNTPSTEFFALQQAVAGRFSLVRELGRGATGVVFLAQDVALDRHVAIKLLALDVGNQADRRAAFVRAAQAAGGMSHPHIVAIHAVEEHAELAFMVMAFVDGESLGERVRRAGTLSSGDAMRITQEIAWALGHAHARDLLHGGLNPESILLERGTGRAMVSDFGFGAASRATSAPTESGSDLRALGATAWFALTGALPREGSVSPRVPTRFLRAVEKCLAQGVDDSIPNAESFAVEIDVARIGTVAAPPAVQAFVRNAESAGGEMGTALVAAVLTIIVLWSTFGDDMFVAPVFFTAAALAVGLAGSRFAQVILNARQLLAEGYDEAAVRAETLREEAAREETRTGGRRRVRIATWLLLGWAVIKTTGMAFLATADGPDWLGLMGAAGMVIVPTFALRMLWDDVRGGRSLWNRMLAGKLGAFVFRVAGLFLRRRTAVTAPAGEPTGALLGGATRDAFEALPPAQRAQLAAVPPLVERLRAAALRLRGREDPPSRERFASVVTALEGVRLDLLRMNAGVNTNEIAADLARAAEVGARVDQP